MKKQHFLLIILILVLSFFAVLLFSPDMKAYQAKFKAENYERVAEIQSPSADLFELRIVDHLPLDIQIENGDVKNVEIWINKTISQKQRDFIKDRLRNELEVYDSKGGSLTLKLDGRLVLFEGEDWLAARAFAPYNQIFAKESSIIRVVLPKNISLPPKEQAIKEK